MKVTLFVPCFVDVFSPGVAAATVRVLRRAGCDVEFPAGQTCCGQPAFNAGFRPEAGAIARRWRTVFAGAEAVVCPSGACATMAAKFYEELIGPGGPPVYELSQFLVDRLGVVELGARFPHRVGYHDGCHSLRELGVRDQPRRLLGAVAGLELVEVEDAERCCGFGGTFAVDFDEVSRAMADRKLAGAGKGGVEYLVSTEPSCLMHLGARSRKAGPALPCLHIAEILERTP